MNVLKRFRGLIVFLLVASFLAGALVVGKNIFLRQVRKKIEASLAYSRLSLSALPPSLVLEDIRTLDRAPFFSARRVTVGISYVSLLRRVKPLTILIEEPVVRMTGEPGPARKYWPLPVAIEKGIVRDGEIFVNLRGGSLSFRGVKALFSEKGDAFSFQAAAAEGNFTPSAAGPAPPPTGAGFGGAVTLSISGKGPKVTVHRAVVEGPGFIVKARGRLVNPENPVLELKTSFDVETSFVARLLKLPFSWTGSAEGSGLFTRSAGAITFHSNLSGPAIILNGVPLGRVSGSVAIDGKGRGEVDLSVPGGGTSDASVLVKFGGGGIEGRVSGTRLDPIISYVKIPWPVRSPVWGNFSIEKGRLEAEGEFRDEREEYEHPFYPFRGKFLFSMDLKTQELSFSSPEIDSSFGRLEVRGGVRVGRDCDVDLRGEVKDVKQARAFTSYVLRKDFVFPEIRGRGTVAVKIAGDYRSPRVTADFFCLPAGFAKFDAMSVEGSLDIQGDAVTGRFRVGDADLKGEIGLAVAGARVEADLRLDDGRVERILPPLDIDLPLRGRASGSFKLVQQGEALDLKGNFASPEISILGQPVRSCRGGLEWKNDALRLTKLSGVLYGGTVAGDLMMTFPRLGFDMDLSGKGFRLSEIGPGLEGTLELTLKGKGVFGTDRPGGAFSGKGLVFPPIHDTDAGGDWTFGYADDRISLDVIGGFLPGGNEFRMKFELPLHKDEITADIKGSFDDIDRLLPWKGARGRLNYLGEIRGSRSAPSIDGVVDLQGSLMPLPGFAHALTDYTGLAFIKEGRITLRSFQGKLGGGDIRGAGTIDLGAKGIEAVDIRVDGTNMLLSPLARTRALTNGWVRIVKDIRSFVLDGELDVTRLSWRRELTEKISVFSSPYTSARKEKGFFDDLALNLRLRAGGNAWMENALGRVSGKFDLTVTGSVGAPVILGDIEAVDGEIYFQDRKFRVIRGRLSFFNPASVEPFLDFRGETYVKDYRVTFALNGLVDSLRPEFTSSPPLPPEDVLALLALGEAFRRTYSYDTTTRLSTASLLSFQISDRARKRAESLFRLARFRVDPFVMSSSSEMSARLTVGRQIARNLSILYSTNLTTQREEIVRMEWEISKDFSLVGIRNEWGRISVDVKIRKRF
jgi:hypothetical protein